MTTVRPTKKQRQLLDYIEGFIAQHGYSPSYREIMNGLQYSSVATVALHVGNLIKRGHLRKRDHSARSLEVVGDAERTSLAEKLSSESESHEQWLVGRIEHAIAQAVATDNRQKVVGIGQILVDALMLLELPSQAKNLQAKLAATYK